MSNGHDSLEVPLGSVDWGGLRRLEPVSLKWGFDRGLPVDRHYIEAFLAHHAGLIHGRCIEVLNADYTRKFGGDRVSLADIVDINPNNPRATIVGDLTDPSTLAKASYDCFILTQTLTVIFDVAAVIRNCYAALKPGGSLLVTAACMCRYSPHPEDFWRLTDRSLARLVSENTDSKDFQVGLHGNLIASMAFLQGMAASELSPDELDHFDERFPIVATAVVRKGTGL